MISKTLYYLFIAVSFMTTFSISAYRYDDYSEGRSFFSDGQEWIFNRYDADGVKSEYRLKAKVIGDTAISSYMDYYGEIVRVDQPCKTIRVISDEPGAAEQRFAAYEWDAEVYVYSDLAEDFVQMLGFNKKENVKFLYCGEKWNTDRVDYVSPHGRLLKRYACSGVGLDKSAGWIYRAGADRVWLNSTKWNDPGRLELVSYRDPECEELYLPEDFSVETFVPDNQYYADGKVWIYRSAYHEQRGNSDVLVHMTVESEEEAEHMTCKRVSYAIEGKEPGHSATVCSAGGVMYERGYMNILTPRYDFNILPGGMVVTDNPDSEVVGLDYVEVAGVNRKRIIFKGETSDSLWKYWVEGIGGNAGNDCLPREEMEDMPEIYMPGTFVRCLENGSVVFEQEDFSKDRSSVDTILSDNENDINGTVDAYTLEGLQANKLAPGRIIIRQGKKYLPK